MPFETPILIIDDSSTIRIAVRQMLKEAGYKKIIVTSNAEHGLNTLKESLAPSEQKIGLVLCEWAMPKMTGLELLQEIRKEKDFKGLPIIMVTNEKRTEHILEAVENGATDVIFKPFAPSLLIKKVNKLLLPSEEHPQAQKTGFKSKR